MKTIAVLGASGFIGTRIVEMFYLASEDIMLRPIVRTPSHLARLSRFSLDSRIADARDQEALTKALAGCDAVVHAVAGSPEVITSAIEPVYRAAERAGVRRLIYLSSASVHGQSPPPGVHEESALSAKQPLEYNNAKVQAEWLLQGLRESGRVELVILRPSIVFGPRSFWVGNFADGLLSGRAYLIDHGRGTCNTVYVDNLVHAIKLAIARDGIDRQAFFITDQEQVSWVDLYQPIAQALGKEIPRISIPPVTVVPSKSLREKLRSIPGAAVARSLLPQRLRRAFSAGVGALGSRKRGRSPWQVPLDLPEVTLEMSLLYTCAVKLPDKKAKQMLGYDAPVTFAQGCERTIAWMEFAGYPMIGSQELRSDGHNV